MISFAFDGQNKNLGLSYTARISFQMPWTQWKQENEQLTPFLYEEFHMGHLKIWII
jgi:hypothetical protein